MLFVQIEFFILLAVSLLYLSLVRNNTAQKVFLLATSYYFYAYWDYRFLGLILLSTGVDYAIGLALKHEQDLSKRKLLLTISIVINLAFLGFFKYFNFFIASLQSILTPLGWNLSTLSIILPVGISFYTFRTLSYTIDVYRKDIPACDSLLDYSLFVAFFPQLLAGPITRASHFLPQLQKTTSPVRDNLALGFRLFVIGLFKKIFVADRLALFVDHVFTNAGAFDAPTTWLAVCSYTIQIYCDFSGYSDMAIGTARMLGYELSENFNFPYLARSISEFWRRWHITLSSWIRDYLYIPLGGSRKGSMRTHMNLMIAMLLCGLWHGAAWTFVFWGGLHGAYQTISRVWSGKQNSQINTNTSWLSFLSGWAVTILSVMVGWVFFKAQDFSQAGLMLRQMFLPSPGVSWTNPFALFVLGGFALVHLAQVLGGTQFHHLPVKSRYTPAVLFSMIWLVILFYPDKFTPFIYLQF